MMLVQLPEIDDSKWIAARWAEIEARLGIRDGNWEDVYNALWPSPPDDTRQEG